MTYKELIESSNKIARAFLKVFKKNSCKENDDASWIIALQMKPSIRTIVTMLAVWKCGASYLPLSPFYKKKGVQQVLSEAQPQLVIIDDDASNLDHFDDFLVMKIGEIEKVSKKCSEKYVTDDYSFTLGKDCEAITIYTSGTLSAAKGTQLHHSCCQQRLEWQWKQFPFQEDETHCLARNALYHIDHFAEIWAPLCTGKCLVIVDDKFCKDPLALTNVMENQNIKRFIGLPAFIDAILDVLMKESRKNFNENVSLWISTGEPLTIATAQKFFNHFTEKQKLVNFYGCTETTGDCAFFTIESKEHLEQLEEIPIGRPMSNTFIYVLNKALALATSDEMGEIFVSGGLVAQYYIYDNHFNTKLSRNHLNIAPTQSRLFRTRDYGVIRDGLLYYRGRVNRIVRIDENLIELHPIENFLRTLPYISAVAVVPTTNLNLKLLVFICLAHGFSYISESEIEAELHEQLSSNIDFEVILVMDLPRDINGEVQCKDLLNGKYTVKPKEKKLVIDVELFDEADKELARQVLQIIGDTISPSMDNETIINADSNFFEIGGNSLNLIETVAQLGERQFHISTAGFMRSQDMRDLIFKIKISQNHEVKLNLDPKPEMTIKTIVDDDFEECANLLATCYFEKDILMKFLSTLKIENIYRFLETNWSLFTKKGLSFKVVDKSGRTVGVSVNCDRGDEAKLKKNDFKVMKTIFEYIGFVEMNSM